MAIWSHDPFRKGAGAIAMAALILLVAHLAMSALVSFDPTCLDTPRLKQGVRFIRTGHAASPPRLAVAFVGSSRPNDGFVPDAVMARLRDRHGVDTESFNFGYPGAGPIRSYVVTKRLAERDAAPEVMLLEICPINMNGAGDKDGLMEAVENEDLAPHERDDLRNRGWCPPNRDLIARALETPWYSNRTALLRHVAPRWLDTMAETVSGPNDRGWCRLDQNCYPSPKWETRMEQIRGEWGPKLQRFEPNEKSLGAIRATLEICNRQGTRTALVLMPEGPRFRKFYAAGVMDGYRGLAGELGAEFGSQVIDANLWCDDEAFFSDSHHLNGTGAARFTEKLTDEIAPLVRGGAIAKR